MALKVEEKEWEDHFDLEQEKGEKDETSKARSTIYPFQILFLVLFIYCFFFLIFPILWEVFKTHTKRPSSASKISKQNLKLRIFF